MPRDTPEIVRYNTTHDNESSKIHLTHTMNTTPNVTTIGHVPIGMFTTNCNTNVRGTQNPPETNNKTNSLRKVDRLSFYPRIAFNNEDVHDAVDDDDKIPSSQYLFSSQGSKSNLSSYWNDVPNIPSSLVINHIRHSPIRLDDSLHSNDGDEDSRVENSVPQLKPSKNRDYAESSNSNFSSYWNDVPNIPSSLVINHIRHFPIRLDDSLHSNDGDEDSHVESSVSQLKPSMNRDYAESSNSNFSSYWNDVPNIPSSLVISHIRHSPIRLDDSLHSNDSDEYSARDYAKSSVNPDNIHFVDGSVQTFPNIGQVNTLSTIPDTKQSGCERTEKSQTQMEPPPDVLPPERGLVNILAINNQIRNNCNRAKEIETSQSFAERAPMSIIRPSLNILDAQSINPQVAVNSLNLLSTSHTQVPPQDNLHVAPATVTKRSEHPQPDVSTDTFLFTPEILQREFVTVMELQKLAEISWTEKISKLSITSVYASSSDDESVNDLLTERVKKLKSATGNIPKSVENKVLTGRIEPKTEKMPKKTEPAISPENIEKKPSSIKNSVINTCSGDGMDEVISPEIMHQMWQPVKQLQTPKVPANIPSVTNSISSRKITKTPKKDVTPNAMLKDNLHVAPATVTKRSKHPQPAVSTDSFLFTPEILQKEFVKDMELQKLAEINWMDKISKQKSTSFYASSSDDDSVNDLLSERVKRLKYAAGNMPKSVENKVRTGRISRLRKSTFELKNKKMPEKTGPAIRLGPEKKEQNTSVIKELAVDQSLVFAKPSSIKNSIKKIKLPSFDTKNTSEQVFKTRPAFPPSTTETPADVLSLSNRTSVFQKEEAAAAATTSCCSSSVANNVLKLGKKRLSSGCNRFPPSPDDNTNKVVLPERAEKMPKPPEKNEPNGSKQNVQQKSNVECITLSTLLEIVGASEQAAAAEPSISSCSSSAVDNAMKLAQQRLGSGCNHFPPSSDDNTNKVVLPERAGKMPKPPEKNVPNGSKENVKQKSNVECMLGITGKNSPLNKTKFVSNKTIGSKEKCIAISTDATAMQEDGQKSKDKKRSLSRQETATVVSGQNTKSSLIETADISSKQKNQLQEPLVKRLRTSSQDDNVIPIQTKESSRSRQPIIAGKSTNSNTNNTVESSSRRMN